MPAGDPVKASAGNVGYARSGPYHKDGTARVTDDPIGDALPRERLFSPPQQMLEVTMTEVATGTTSIRPMT